MKPAHLTALNVAGRVAVAAGTAVALAAAIALAHGTATVRANAPTASVDVVRLEPVVVTISAERFAEIRGEVAGPVIVQREPAARRPKAAA